MVVKLCFFYMDGCHWCDVFKPTWKQLQDKYKTTSTDNQKYIFVECESSKLESSLEAKEIKNKLHRDITSYPTIFINKNDKYIEHKGDRSFESMIKFINSNSNTNSSSSSNSNTNSSNSNTNTKDSVITETEYTNTIDVIAKSISEDLTNYSNNDTTSSVNNISINTNLNIVQTNTEIKLILYYMNNCTWCEKFKPTWKQLKQNTPYKFEKCERNKMDEFTETKAIQKEFEIKSFPSIFVKIGNDYFKYEGDRDLQSILEFIAEKYKIKNSSLRGGKIDYRIKYKKYKKMYAEMIDKYNKLKYK